MSIYKILGLVSALALMVAVTAYTEANAGSSPTTSKTSTKESPILNGIQADMKTNWDKMKSDAKQAAADTRAAAQGDNLGANFNARFIGNDSATQDVIIEQRITAKGMLNQPVSNTKNEKIGTLKDIILDSSGRAVMVVVSDGGFLGIGDKLAAFDYSLVMQQNADGDVIMPLSDDSIKKVASFSYDPKEASDKVHVIPSNGYSISELLKGKLVDPQNAALGNIENITFKGGEASQVIVAFDQKMGLGGERAALDFDDLALSKTADGNLNFRMNTRQSAEFEQYKNTKAN